MTLDDIDLTDLDRFTKGFPHHVFTFLRGAAPVWFHPPTAHTPGGEGFWVLSRYADVQNAAADAATFSSVTGGTRDAGGTLIEDLPLGFAAVVLLNMTDDPHHKRVRKLVTANVSPRALAAVEDELLSAVTHGRVEGADGRLEALADLELQMFFSLLVHAASETTRNSIAVGLAALIEHPDAWHTLQAERALLPTAVEEMLRWASSTPYNRRTATRDVTVRGQTIHAGDKVTLWWASANRDAAVFANPFHFDIRRSPNSHLAFGHGAHFCLGANLARIEMRLVFDALLDRFDAIALAGPIEWTRSNKHTGVRHMPVTVRTRG